MANQDAPKNLYERMLQIDRRWTFLLLALVVVLVYLLDIKVPVYTTKEVRNIYDRSESLQEGDVIKEVNGEPLVGSADAVKLYDRLKYGGRVNLGVQRGNESMRLRFYVG